MDFTREPIIETVITPKEGFKIAVRSSKSVGQEEYFVDAVEVVTFGNAHFFRSLERPKSFLVPVSDYEVLEVREARMILKNVGMDRSIKIGGGREAPMRSGKETEKTAEIEPQAPAEAETAEATGTNGGTADKKRDRRTRHRRRRGRDDTKEGAAGSVEEGASKTTEENMDLSEPRKNENGTIASESIAVAATTTSVLTGLLPPPPTLISETIARYKENILFKGAFYTKEEGTPAPEKAVEVKEEEQSSFREDEDSGYPSLDVIDEAIDKPKTSEIEIEKIDEPLQASNQEVEKEDLWDFSKDVDVKDEENGQ